MNKKNLPWIIAGLVAVGIGTYFVVRWARNRSGDQQKNTRKFVISRNPNA